MLVRLFPKGISLAMMASIEKSVALWHVWGFVAAWGDRDFSFSACIASSEINIGMISVCDLGKEDLGWWVKTTIESKKKFFRGEFIWPAATLLLFQYKNIQLFSFLYWNFWINHKMHLQDRHCFPSQFKNFLIRFY